MIKQRKMRTLRNVSRGNTRLCDECVCECGLRRSHRWASGELAIRVLAQDDGKWSSEREVNTGVMVISGLIRGNHRGRIRYRAPSLRTAPDVRRQLTPGSSTRTMGLFGWVLWKSVLSDGQECPWHRPRTFPPVRTPPSPRDIAELLPGAKNLLNLICLLTMRGGGPWFRASSRSSALLGALAALNKETWKVGEIQYWGGKAKR